MRSLGWPVVLGVACAVAAVATADSAPDEAKKLTGTWVVESATYDGKPAAKWKDGQLVFAGNKLTAKDAKGNEKSYTLTVDPAKMPKAMDATPPKELAERPWLMIYQLDGDSLKLCIAPLDKRPTKLTDKEGVLVVLKRKK